MLAESDFGQMNGSQTANTSQLSLITLVIFTGISHYPLKTQTSLITTEDHLQCCSIQYTVTLLGQTGNTSH